MERPPEDRLMNASTAYPPLPRDLGNGLSLRRSTAADAEALADFCARVHSTEGWDQPNTRVAAWTRDLLTRPHPTFRPDDFTIVEETATRRIISTLNLISQTWTYEGIPFGVGRPELVGTLPEYRKRGLVRLQFDEIHRWCAQRGQMVQAITGIPYYYRQFGYEMALDLAGRRFGNAAQVPQLKDGEHERYLIRPAAVSDLPLIAALYEQACRRYAIACQRTPEILRYELDGQSAENSDRHEIRIIEDDSRRPVGYFLHPAFLGRTGLFASWYELCAGVSWLEVTPAVVRYLWSQGQAYARRDQVGCDSFGFLLGAQHPAYAALGGQLPHKFDPYAWYLRVPDLPGFLNHIRPALQRRLEASIAGDLTRTLKVSFYRSGVRLSIEGGQLTAIEPWLPQVHSDEGDAAFPGLTFLQLLFGYRSFDELRHAFADCTCEADQTAALIEALFPKKLSDVLPLA
jgi:hypothetical protein